MELEGRVLSFSKALTKGGKEYIRGTLRLPNRVEPLGFKVWENNLGGIEEGVSQGTIVKVTGEISEYLGTKELTVSKMVKTEGDLYSYLQKRYNKDDLLKEFKHLTKKNISKSGVKIFGLLYSQVKDNFPLEAASIYHHDGVENGLLAHSVKVLKIADFAWEMYGMSDSGIDKDLLMLGTLIHDLGKAVEYKAGAMSEVGMVVSHRTLAVEMLAGVREEVVSLKGEEWYYRLMAIFAQHHGEYEETPRARESMLVHYIDMFESSMTGILEAILTGESEVRVNGVRIH